MLWLACSDVLNFRARSIVVFCGDINPSGQRGTDLAHANAKRNDGVNFT